MDNPTQLRDAAYPQTSISAEHTGALSENFELQAVDASASTKEIAKVASVSSPMQFMADDWTPQNQYKSDLSQTAQLTVMHDES